MLHREIPGVQSGQAHLLRIDKAVNPVREQRVAIRALRLCIQNRVDIQKRGTLGKIEDAFEVVWRVEVLNSQNRKVLGHTVTKDRAKSADIKGPSVTHTNDGLAGDLIGNAQPWRQVGETVLHVSV